MEVFCLLQEDLRNSLAIVHQFNAGAVVLWGSANDTNSREKCSTLKQYLNSVLGPTIKELSTGTPNSLILSSDPDILL
jgi:Hyaluronidase.